jgi:hypothetical protein
LDTPTKYVPWPIKRGNTPDLIKPEVPIRSSLLKSLAPLPGKGKFSPRWTYDKNGRRELTISNDWYRDAFGKLHFYDEQFL